MPQWSNVLLRFWFACSMQSQQTEKACASADKAIVYFCSSDMHSSQPVQIIRKLLFFWVPGTGKWWHFPHAQGSPVWRLRPCFYNRKSYGSSVRSKANGGVEEASSHNVHNELRDREREKEDGFLSPNHPVLLVYKYISLYLETPHYISDRRDQRGRNT